MRCVCRPFSLCLNTTEPVANPSLTWSVVHADYVRHRVLLGLTACGFWMTADCMAAGRYVTSALHVHHLILNHIKAKFFHIVTVAGICIRTFQNSLLGIERTPGFICTADIVCLVGITHDASSTHALHIFQVTHGRQPLCLTENSPYVCSLLCTHTHATSHRETASSGPSTR